MLAWLRESWGFDEEREWRLNRNGAQGRNRTNDTVIFSHVLYQLSYLGTGEPGGSEGGDL